MKQHAMYAALHRRRTEVLSSVARRVRTGVRARLALGVLVLCPLTSALPDRAEGQEPAESPIAAPETFRGAIKFISAPLFGFRDQKGTESWKNNITITERAMLFEYADKSLVTITAPLSGIRSISYGQKAKRTGAGFVTGVGGTPEVAWLALFALPALLHETRHHYVSVAWSDQEFEDQACFEVKGDHLRRLLNTLSFRSWKPIYAGTEDRKYLASHGILAQPDPGAPEASPTGRR